MLASFMRVSSQARANWRVIELLPRGSNEIEKVNREKSKCENATRIRCGKRHTHTHTYAPPNGE